MAGLNLLSFSEIKAWAWAMDIHELCPLEVEALIILDSVHFASEDEKEEKEDAPIVPRSQVPWPKRKT